MKNDFTAYEAGSLDELFSRMGPFDCNLSNDKDKEGQILQSRLPHDDVLLSVSIPKMLRM